jgi:hypothetical protein
VKRLVLTSFFVLLFIPKSFAQIPLELRIGRANHAFDHLGNIGGQADAAAASGATIIYAGLRGGGYQGMPPETEFKRLCEQATEYNRRAKSKGIELVIGYVCATSIVKLDTFDKNWTDEFRRQFKARPTEWRQQDRNGKPLVSWYGGDYSPACMNNPDWRAYERAMVRYSLETGHDGIFFDNPTVHPHGCYCSHCMRAFAKTFDPESIPKARPGQLDRDEHLRRYADSHANEFQQFRSTIARDFLADMRRYARSINPRALITCNNSLNDPSVFYSQCRMYGYNIHEMSKVEDFVVVEDMNSQPRTEANGKTIEYGPTYKMLRAISHKKPIVAVTIAGGDYHTPPNLMRLAMAEAAANDASYLSWPTWPDAQRKRMIEGVRPEADFLHRHEGLLNGTLPRADVVLFLPFRRWLVTDQCAASPLTVALTSASIQYEVVCEDDFPDATRNHRRSVFLVESRSVLNPDEKDALESFEKAGGKVVTGDSPNWLQSVRQAIGQPSVVFEGPPTVRAVVHDQQERTIVQLYNLNVQRLSSFEDKLTPAANMRLTVSVPSNHIQTVSILDDQNTPYMIGATEKPRGEETLVTVSLPRLAIHAFVVVDHVAGMARPVESHTPPSSLIRSPSPAPRSP